MRGVWGEADFKDTDELPCLNRPLMVGEFQRRIEFMLGPVLNIGVTQRDGRTRNGTSGGRIQHPAHKVTGALRVRGCWRGTSSP